MLPLWFEWSLDSYLSYIQALSRPLSSLIEEKGKNVEVNFAYQDDVFDPSNMTHLDVADFFESPEKKNDVNETY
ncbi:uncharacterized protein E5676_scaffold409G00300 [Cucumis melo var. makuwa]|uniref:Uncharacterized protein n=1 Tax=Cucumis melo var. makuwa TaxID=1194695 RepID=A0A5A7SNT4_CUCMM|nr:uncharacterized protein E6C27_scaffold139G004600 [Cucumis melo var. makuwa]TYK04434.1 uncharacterized protein E5676_scaffold409G00300 [Cucumis melo var. makuwa]